MIDMNTEEIKTLVELVKAGTESVNAYWSLYSAVALAFVGYAFAAERPIQVRNVRIVLTAVFALFAFSNWHSLISEQKKSLEVSAYVVAKLNQNQETEALAKSFNDNRPSDPAGVTGFHLFLDIAVVGLVLFAPTIKRQKNEEH